MFNKLELIETSIAHYEASIKSLRELIKLYKESIKKNRDTLNEFKARHAEGWYLDILKDFIKNNEDLINKYEASLKDDEARLVQLQIEKFVVSGKKFKVMNGGTS